MTYCAYSDTLVLPAVSLLRQKPEQRQNLPSGSLATQGQIRKSAAGKSLTQWQALTTWRHAARICMDADEQTWICTVKLVRDRCGGPFFPDL